jgi:hypothetical protein
MSAVAEMIFDSVCDELERTTGLDRLAIRGTVRLALKSVGLDPKTLTIAEFKLVAEHVLPAELRKRGIADAPQLCMATLDKMAGAGAKEASGSDSPDEVFRRLGAH